MAARLRADTDRRSPLRDLAGAKRLRLLAPQAVSPAPAADSSDRNGALASAPPLDSRALRCAVPNSRPWSASRPRESFQRIRKLVAARQGRPVIGDPQINSL